MQHINGIAVMSVDQVLSLFDTKLITGNLHMHVQRETVCSNTNR